MARLSAMLGIWLDAERGRFVLWLPVALIAGILLYFALPVEPAPWLAWAPPLLCLAALALAWRWVAFRFGLALLLVLTVGFGRAEWRTSTMPPLLHVPSRAPEITGIVADLRRGADGERITLAAASLDGGAPLTRQLRIKRAPYDTDPLAPGMVVALRARIFAPDRPAYPGAHDFARDDFFNGIGAVGYALGRVAVIAPASPDAFSLGLTRLRLAIAAHIAAVLPADTSAIAITLLTGGEQAIPRPERASFVAAGLAHLLAVAGLHVGIVMGLVAVLLRLAFSLFERPNLLLPRTRIIAVLTLLGGAAYAVLTGVHLPILRSIAMAALFTLGIVSGRRAISLRGLGVAVMVIGLLTPEQVLGASFQMSFSAVLALIAGYAALQPGLGRLEAALGRTGPVVLPLIEIAFTSLLAGGASMPFAAYQFHQIQPYWILANLIAVPLTALWVMPCGLLALGAMPLGLDHFPLLAMGLGIRPIVVIAGRIAMLPEASMAMPPSPGLAMMVLAFGLCWLCFWRSAVRFAGIALILGAIGWSVFGFDPPDFVITPDARVIAVRAPGRDSGEDSGQISIFGGKQGRPAILAEVLELWPRRQAVPVDGCAADGCDVTYRRGSITVAATAPKTCPPTIVLIAAVPADLACARGAPWILDRFSVWHDGAIEGWVADGRLRVISDRSVQGTRPWVPAWPDWKYGGGGSRPPIPLTGF